MLWVRYFYPTPRRIHNLSVIQRRMRPKLCDPGLPARDTNILRHDQCIRLDHSSGSKANNNNY